MISFKEQLEKNGYCIIPNVLNDYEINKAISMFKNWKNTIINHDEIHKAIDPHGIYKHHEIGHQQHAWFIRTNPNVQAIFKKLWNCDDLIVSFDGFCYISKENKQKDKIWTHTDQGHDNNNLCYQGFVSLTSNQEMKKYQSEQVEHGLLPTMPIVSFRIPHKFNNFRVFS